VIITPAVPNGHSEWNYFVERGFQVKKKGRGFRIITKDTFVVCSCWNTWKDHNFKYFGAYFMRAEPMMLLHLGGIVENYNSNLIGDGKTVTVVEADEFDRSFAFASIASMDADHLDIYGTSDAIEASFLEFADK
jgi:UDP-N-acetylmuramate--alanine ligase